VQELAGDNANIIFGAMYDESTPDIATITVIATGLDGSAAVKTPSFLGSQIKPSPLGGLGQTPKSGLTGGVPSFINNSTQPKQPVQTEIVQKPIPQVHIQSQTSEEKKEPAAEHGGIKIPEFLQKNRHK
jgi:cell division protein FtsZ